MRHTATRASSFFAQIAPACSFAPGGLGAYGAYAPPRLRAGNAFALSVYMSKHNPNQDFYKIQGRDQSDGPDRAIEQKFHKHELAQSDKEQAEHPAVKRSTKKKK